MWFTRDSGEVGKIEPGGQVETITNRLVDAYGIAFDGRGRAWVGEGPGYQREYGGETPFERNMEQQMAPPCSVVPRSLVNRCGTLACVAERHRSLQSRQRRAIALTLRTSDPFDACDDQAGRPSWAAVRGRPAPSGRAAYKGLCWCEYHAGSGECAARLWRSPAVQRSVSLEPASGLASSHRGSGERRRSGNLLRM